MSAGRCPPDAACDRFADIVGRLCLRLSEQRQLYARLLAPFRPGTDAVARTPARRMSILVSVPSGSLVDQAVRRVRDHIRANSLKAGDPLPGEGRFAVDM